MRLAQAPPGAQAPGSGYKGGFSPLGAWFTRLCALSPTLERRAEAARGVTVVYESFAVWFRAPSSFTFYVLFFVTFYSLVLITFYSSLLSRCGRGLLLGELQSHRLLDKG